MPPGDGPAAVAGVPVLEVPASAYTSSAPPAAEPVVALEPVNRRSPVGLLAMAATVCVVGVGAGAIRTITAQRASPTTIA